MATHSSHLIDGPANGTISKGQFLKYASGGWVACSGTTDLCTGVAFNDAVQGGVVCVQIGGKVIFLNGAGGTIADGAKVAPTAGGLGQTAVTTQFPRLQALGAVAANAYGEGLWISDVTVL